MKILKPLLPLIIVTTIIGFLWAFSSDSSAETIIHPEETITIEEPDEMPLIESLGEFKISYYCIENYPHICNNGDATITATGAKTTPGRTVAVDPKMIPYGTELIINDHHYIAEDCGGSIKDKRIDICVTTHQEALKNGIDYYEVFIVHGGD